MRISKYKNIFIKDHAPNCTEKVFVIEKVKNAVSRTYLIEEDRKKSGRREEIILTFYERVIKRKRHKLYAKWKGYNNSFNSWIDKKDIKM